ncbi:hypothetical protein [Vibrio cholerae]|uniref:hypothetical protein n=1 Tax=Vibrio cholerae TaxID=666 RepID=UPI00208C01B6|nr:hypothetical protein VCSRO43_3553 [Vibrio cholerae]
MKTFLERNKIYFDTAIATLVGLASIALSVMAILVSINANSIAQSQLKVAEASQQLDMWTHLPKVSATFYHVDTTEGARQETLEIVNKGQELYDLELKPIAILGYEQDQIIHSENQFDPKLQLKKGELPLVSYFPNVIYHYNENTGVLARIPLKNVNGLDKRLEEISDSLRSNVVSYNFYIRRYLHISYIDNFGITHKKYYRFTAGGTSVPISMEEGSTLFNNYENNIKNKKLINYKESTSQEILNRLL